ncbi:MAG: hypothetical protein O7G83_12480 [Proteobacteria bacterium]|nr:hypothetical protein [Pseudomonadota bacterium]
MTAKIEKRDGKIFVGDNDDGYFQKRGLSLRFSATDIGFVKKIDLDPYDDDPVPVVSEFFNGTATLNDTLGVIGDARRSHAPIVEGCRRGILAGRSA